MSIFDSIQALFTSLSSIALDTVVIVIGGAICLAIVSLFILILDQADTMLFFPAKRKGDQRPAEGKGDLRESLLVVGLILTAVEYFFVLVVYLNRSLGCSAAAWATVTGVLGVSLGLMVSVMIVLVLLKAVELLSGKSIRT